MTVAKLASPDQPGEVRAKVLRPEFHASWFGLAANDNGGPDASPRYHFSVTFVADDGGVND